MPIATGKWGPWAALPPPPLTNRALIRTWCVPTQNDAACRVIARLVRERDEARAQMQTQRTALAQAAAAAPAAAAAVEGGGVLRGEGRGGGATFRDRVLREAGASAFFSNDLKHVNGVRPN